MGDQLPISDLIENRQKQLGLGRSELALRRGFKNISKGIRRIDGVCAGDLNSPAARMVLTNLPAALEVEKDTVENALHTTREVMLEAERQAEARREAAWRESFKPSAYLVTKGKRPSSITLYGMTGGAERWLKIPLDLSKAPVTYAAQAHEFAKRTPQVTFFGRTTGFIVNYTPDHAVRFDLDGNPVEHFNRAYILEQVEVFVGKRRLPERRMFAI
ncbi:MAG TPA: hypothetical protein VEH76_06275 [Methylocystis sp.]|nr:hypothetical protein [Methylocystis sp.]